MNFKVHVDQLVHQDTLTQRQGKKEILQHLSSHLGFSIWEISNKIETSIWTTAIFSYNLSCVYLSENVDLDHKKLRDVDPKVFVYKGKPQQLQATLTVNQQYLAAIKFGGFTTF